MQLLDSEQLEFAFQRHGITLEVQARRFYGDVWQVIQEAERVRDGAGLQEKTKTIRALFRSYFDLVADWRVEQLDSCETPDLSGRELMPEMQALLPSFEKQFCRYALCYMELNRVLIRGRSQISLLSKACSFDEKSAGLEINHGTGILLDRAHAEMRELVQKRKRLEHMRAFLKTSDVLMENLGAALPRVMGPEGDRQLTLFKGALRRLEFERAQRLVCQWPTGVLRSAGQSALSLFAQRRDDLGILDSLVLHSGEVSLPLTILASDERKLRSFLDKHNLPYMLFHYRNLIHLGYQLGRIGSLEGLIIQHAKLSSLAARPQTAPDQVRRARYAVIMPAKALLENGFPTLGPIFNEMEMTQTVLDRLFSQTREYMTS